jgi:glutamine synthetase
MKHLAKWLKERHITEVECLVPDMSGVARGKILPADKFVRSQSDSTLRLPESVFTQTVTGDFVQTAVADPIEPDMMLRPDPASVRLVPWYEEPTAQVINDCYYRDGRPVTIAPRQVLRGVLERYRAEGWRPVVAPELEFFLVAKNTDPDYPLEPPIGRSGRAETGRQSYGIDAVNEFDPLFEEVYDHCEAQEIDIDTLIHEAGAAQVEINFNHGDPLAMADQAFLFKRTVRQVALRHGVYATFMAKPIESEPGSAMHIHQSVESISTGGNLFATKRGKDSRLFLAHIAGLQKYLPEAMPLLAPNVNSYRRLIRHLAAPINVHWGRENRTVGLRVPESTAAARRVENRVVGADVNPYLAIAASLACGYLGMKANLEPTEPVKGSAYRYAYTLPRYLPDALARLKSSKDLREILGGDFVDLLLDVKQAEHDAYQQVISAWEREHLLLNV